MNINYIFNERLRKARIGMGLTKEELALRLKMNKSTIQRYESGTITNVKLPVVEAIARVLEVNPNWLLGKTNDPSIVIIDEKENSTPIPKKRSAIIKQIAAMPDDRFEEMAAKLEFAGYIEAEDQ